MGAYLDKPVKDKISNDCENEFLKCGSCSMQGWRVTQEDAHNCILDFDTDCSLFAVYDGHGGHEVAEYASQHLPNFIKELEAYKKGSYEEALKEAFLDFDALLTTEPVIDKLKEIAFSKSKDEQENDGSNSIDDDAEDEVDVKTLKKEAGMPLNELIALYQSNESQKAKLVGKDKDANPDSVVSSSSNLSETSVKETKTNGIEETVLNGESGAGEGGCSSTNDDAVSSSSQHVNGDIVSTNHSSTAQPEEDSSDSCIGFADNLVSTSGDRTSKKMAVIKMYRSLLEDSYESDSDDNDESFHAADTNVSSEEDENTNKDNGNSESKNDSAGAEDNDDEEEEDDEVDDDDDDDEGDDDEEDALTEDVAVDDQATRKKEEPGSDSGCTAVVCLVHKDIMYVANAGDSRAVLCRDGQAVDLSIDHKPDDEVELKRIVAAGGEVTWEGRVNGGLNLSRALGDHSYKKVTDLDATKQMIIALPDIKVEKIDKLHDEFIVLACDGIWNSMSSQEVVDFVRPLINNGEKLSVICEKLFDKCIAPGMQVVLCEGNGSDNMTCIIVKFNKDDNEVVTGAQAGIAKRQSDSPIKEETDTV